MVSGRRDASIVETAGACTLIQRMQERRVRRAPPVDAPQDGDRGEPVHWKRNAEVRRSRTPERGCNMIDNSLMTWVGGLAVALGLVALVAWLVVWWVTHND